MTIEEAIKKAIEGGWKTPLAFEGWAFEIQSNLAFLDKEFWKCLGVIINGKEGDLKIKNGFGETLSRQSTDRWWKEQWHKFIEYLAEGKTPSDFFANLS